MLREKVGESARVVVHWVLGCWSTVERKALRLAFFVTKIYIKK